MSRSAEPLSQAMALLDTASMSDTAAGRVAVPGRDPAQKLQARGGLTQQK